MDIFNSIAKDVVAQKLKDYGVGKTFIDTFDYTDSKDSEDSVQIEKTLATKYVDRTDILKEKREGNEIFLTTTIVLNNSNVENIILGFIVKEYSAFELSMNIIVSSSEEAKEKYPNTNFKTAFLKSYKKYFSETPTEEGNFVRLKTEENFSFSNEDLLLESLQEQYNKAHLLLNEILSLHASENEDFIEDVKEEIEEQLPQPPQGGDGEDGDDQQEGESGEGGDEGEGEEGQDGNGEGEGEEGQDGQDGGQSDGEGEDGEGEEGSGGTISDDEIRELIDNVTNEIDVSEQGGQSTEPNIDIDDLIEEEIMTGEPVDVDEEIGTDVTDVDSGDDVNSNDIVDSDDVVDRTKVLSILEGILQNEEIKETLFDKQEVGVFVKTLPQEVKEKLFVEADLPSDTNNQTLINLISEQENIN